MIKQPLSAPLSAALRAGLAALCLTTLLLAGCTASPPGVRAGETGDAFSPAVAPSQLPRQPGPNRGAETRFGDYLSSLHARAQNDNKSASAFMSRVLASEPRNAALLRAAFLLKLQDGALADAIPMAKQLLQADPANQIAGLLLAADAFRRHDYAGAKEWLGKTGPQGLGELLGPLLSGWAEAGLGNTAQALAALEPLSQRQAFAVFRAYHSALIAAAAKQHQTAENWFTETMDSPGGGSIRIAQVYGQFLQANGRHREAAEIYRGVLGRMPRHPLLAEALTSAEAGRGGGPLLIADAAWGAAEALYGIGNVLGQEGRASPLPVVYLRLATFIRADFTEAQTLLAGQLEGMQRWDDAVAIYSALPATSPLYESAQIQSAMAEDRAGRSEAAISSLRGLLAQSPASLDAMMALADLLRANERYAEAASIYDAAIGNIGAPQPHHWPLFYSRGVCLERTGKWQEAERDLQLALRLAPDQPLVLNYLAYSWIDHGVRLAEARAMVESAARQRPNDGAIIDSLGWALYRTGDNMGAVAALETAIGLLPQDPVINDHLGDAYWQVGRKREARFQWRRALLFKPETALVTGIEKKLDSGLDHGANQRLASPSAPSAPGKP